MTRYSDLATALAGSGLVAMYDKDSNATTSAWDDARGTSGFGPQLVATGTPTLASDGYTTNGASSYLASAATSLFDATAGAVWMAVIAKFGSAQTGEVSFYGGGGGGFGARYFTVGGASAYDPPATIKLIGSVSGASTRTPYSTTAQQLLIVQDSTVGGYVKAEVVGPVAVEGTTSSHITGATNALGVGQTNAGGVLTTARGVRLILVGIGDLTAAHKAAIRAYAATYHAQTFDDTARALITDGDSRAWGQGATSQPNDNWPTVLAAKAHFTALNYQLVNLGVPSRQLQTMLANAPYAVDPLYSPARAANLCLLGPCFVNDAATGARTSAQMIADLQSYGNGRKAAGFTMIAIVDPPCNINASIFSSNAAKFAAYKDTRDWLVANGVSSGAFDHVVVWTHAAFNDYAAGAANTLVTTYGSLINADGLHWLTAGYAAMADDIDADLYAAGILPSGGTGGGTAALAYTTQPGGAVSGALLSPQPVLAWQIGGVTQTGITTPATLTLVGPVSGGPGTLSGTTTKAAVAGVIAFTDLRVTGAGVDYQLSAS